MKKRVLEGLLAEGLSMAAMGRQLGCSAETVGTWLDKHGLERPNQHIKPDNHRFGRRELELMLEDHGSLKKVAEIADCSPGTVSYWVRKHGLEPPNQKFRPGRIPAPDREELTAAAGQMGIVAPCRQYEVSYRTMRRWLAEYDLKPHRRSAERPTLGNSKSRKRRTPRRKVEPGTRCTAECKRHGLTEHVGRSDGYLICATCASKRVIHARQRSKLNLLNRRGGRCWICGYKEFSASLDFHHMDPSKKRFGISQATGLARAQSELEVEADKCAVLCKNCHAAVEHEGLSCPSESNFPRFEWKIGKQEQVRKHQ